MSAPTDGTTAPIVGTSSYRVLASVESRMEEGQLRRFKDRLGTALDYFPALAGETVTVATRAEPDYETSLYNPYASADPVNRIIRVPVGVRCSNVTIWHELGHLAIRAEIEAGRDLPKTSEEYCSLYAIARQPPAFIDEDRIPYFGNPGIPRHKWQDVAERVLEYREDHQNYVQKAREWLEVDR